LGVGSKQTYYLFITDHLFITEHWTQTAFITDLFITDHVDMNIVCYERGLL